MDKPLTGWLVDAQIAEGAASCKADACHDNTESAEAQRTEATSSESRDSADAQAAASAIPQEAEGPASQTPEGVTSCAPEGAPHQAREGSSAQEGGASLTSPPHSAAGPSSKPAEGFLTQDLKGLAPSTAGLPKVLLGTATQSLMVFSPHSQRLQR